MTIGTEYWSARDYKNVKKLGQEVMARNYYYACERDGCTGSELYWFLAGFEPWTGHKGKDNGNSSARADHLINDGLNGGSDAKMLEHINPIVNPRKRNELAWQSGIDTGNHPWQFFTFTLDPNKEPQYGYGGNADAILSVDLGKGTVMWFFTYNQTQKFDLSEWVSQ
jgi:hypothetical protein